MKKILGLLGATALTGSSIATTIAMTPVVENKNVEKIEEFIEEFETTYSLEFEETEISNFSFIWGEQWSLWWQFGFDREECLFIANILRIGGTIAQIASKFTARFPRLAAAAAAIIELIRWMENWFRGAANGNGALIKFMYFVPYDVVYA